MKKKILGLGIVSILIAMLVLLTGCGENKDINDDLKANEGDEQVIESNSKLTLENFKRVMQEKGLQIADTLGDNTNSLEKAKYQAEDTVNSTIYYFTEYKEEEDSERLWNVKVKSSSSIKSVVNEQEDNNTNKMEVILTTNATSIQYRDGKCQLKIQVQEDGGDSALQLAREVAKELGY